MKRRKVLQFGAGGLFAAVFTSHRVAAASPTDAAAVAELRKRWSALRAPSVVVIEASPVLTRSHDDWRAQLPADAYGVLFEENTERPFSSALNDEKRDGLFVCRACGLPLFSSRMKYDSGTGWPSFFTSIEAHLTTKLDFKLIWPRTEYHCTKCGGHQGHLFDDGPAPSGQRWCNNGVALSFIPFTS